MNYSILKKSLPLQEAFLNPILSSKNYIFSFKSNSFGKIHDSSEDFMITFTADKSLLQQYYKMRVEYLGSYTDFVDYKNGESELDRKSLIAVVLNKNFKIVGATRYTPSDALHLSNANQEKYQFSVKSFLSNNGFDCDKVFEISGLLIDENYRNYDLAKTIFDFCCNFAKSNNYNYCVGFADRVRCRYYATVLKQLGFPAFIFDKPCINKVIYAVINPLNKVGYDFYQK